MSILNVSIVQSDLHWHDPESNRAAFSEILARASAGTDLVVLPEMFTTGFTMHAEAHAEMMDGPSVAWMAAEAQQTGAAVAGSLIIGEGGGYYNRFILAHPDGRIEHSDKRHRFRLAGEHEHYAAGNRSATFELKGFRIRPLVCYDLRFPVWSRNRGDYDVLIYTANWPERRHLAWETLVRARAIENLSYVIAVNRIGVDGNDIPYAGGSAIVDYLGNYLVEPSGDAGVESATLEMEALVKFRENFPFHLDADDFALAAPR